MPLYAYRCTQCGHRFEKIQNFSAEQERECPECHGLLERPLTAPRLHFKGAGWYVNDYAAKSSEPAGESGSAPAGTSKTGETAAEAKKPSTTSESSANSAAATPAPAAAPTSGSGS